MDVKPGRELKGKREKGLNLQPSSHEHDALPLRHLAYRGEIHVTSTTSTTWMLVCQIVMDINNEKNMSSVAKSVDGFEPSTSCFGNRCAIQLRHTDLCDNMFNCWDEPIAIARNTNCIGSWSSHSMFWVGFHVHVTCSCNMKTIVVVVVVVLSISLWCDVVWWWNKKKSFPNWDLNPDLLIESQVSFPVGRLRKLHDMTQDMTWDMKTCNGY